MTSIIKEGKETAKLKIKRITDRVNGYGMPIVEVTSNIDIKINNMGYDEFESVQNIDESDLTKILHDHFGNGMLMLEIQCPNSIVSGWYKLGGVYLGGIKNGCIIW